MTNEEITKMATTAADVAYNRERLATIRGVLTTQSFIEGHKAGMVAYHNAFNQTFNGLVRMRNAAVMLEVMG